MLYGCFCVDSGDLLQDKENGVMAKIEPQGQCDTGFHRGNWLGVARGRAGQFQKKTVALCVSPSPWFKKAGFWSAHVFTQKSMAVICWFLE